jgi:isopenicillin N synthase-like dioxygenase
MTVARPGSVPTAAKDSDVGYPDDAAPLPVIDVSALREGAKPDRTAAEAQRIEAACRSTGFFYVSGHDVSAELIDRLDAASRDFFRLPLDDKMAIAMAGAAVPGAGSSRWARS